MTTYARRLRRHLARYKVERLGVQENGTWARNGRAYGHILPRSLRWLNLHETMRKEFRAYHQTQRPPFNLHRDFHHLTSSQAMGFNLFFPWFELGRGADLFLKALRLEPSAVEGWAFEHVPDAAEGTNLDFRVALRNKAEVHFEIKLSETGFGRAKADDKHRRKVSDIYRPRLRGKLSLDFGYDIVLRHYQLLRLVAGMDLARGDQVRIIVPKANDSLAGGLEFLQGSLTSECAACIRIVYLEDLVAELRQDSLSPRFTTHLSLFAEKYLVV
jgi:hypothetical protein